MQCGLDEALCLTVCLWRVGLGADMLETERIAGFSEILGDVAGAVVGHNPCDGDAQAGVVTHGRAQERDGAFGLFIRKDVGESDARGVVDADMDVFPADAA